MAPLQSHDDGFTLIELLVVIVILGILAGIAIPAFLRQQEKGYQSQAVADMRTVALALETYATDHDGDYTGLDGATQTTPELADEGFRGSEWVSLLVQADATSYCVAGRNSKVPGKQFVLRSDQGRLRIETAGLPSC